MYDGPCCDFLLRNACVAYEDSRGPGYRRTLLVVRNASDPDGYTQVAFPGEFHEGSGYPFQKVSKDAPVLRGENADRARWRHFEYSWHPQRTGFALEVSMDNLWHVLFHAIPIKDAFERHGLSRTHTDLLPRYTVYWPVPDSRHKPNDAIKPVGAWAGWEVPPHAFTAHAT